MCSMEVAKERKCLKPQRFFRVEANVWRNIRANSEQGAVQRSRKVQKKKYVLMFFFVSCSLTRAAWRIQECQSFRSGGVTATEDGWTVDDLCIWNKLFRQWTGNTGSSAVGDAFLSTESDNLKNVKEKKCFLFLSLDAIFFVLVFCCCSDQRMWKRHVINSELCVKRVSSLFLCRWQKMWWKVRPL